MAPVSRNELDAPLRSVLALTRRFELGAFGMLCELTWSHCNGAKWEGFEGGKRERVPRASSFPSSPSARIAARADAASTVLSVQLSEGHSSHIASKIKIPHHLASPPFWFTRSRRSLKTKKTHLPSVTHWSGQTSQNDVSISHFFLCGTSI